DEMEKTCDEGVELLNINKEQLVTGGRLEALRRFRLDRTQVKDLIDRIVFQTKRLAQTENQGLKINPSGQAEARLRVQQFIYLGVAVNIVLALSLALFFMQNVVKRLGTLTDNTTRLGRGAALNPPLSGGDEIANLDRVFHEMAAALME